MNFNKLLEIVDDDTQHFNGVLNKCLYVLKS